MRTDDDALKTRRSSLSHRKLLLFRCLTVLLPFILLGSVEMALRLVSDKAVDPFIDIAPFQMFEVVGTGNASRARINHKLAYSAQNDYFSVHRPADTIRIFCVGGSACAGWPLPVEQTFSTYLQDYLEQAFPDQRVEVINVATHGLASYRVRSIFEELLEFDPTAIVVYSGNNEFLEERRYTAYDLKGLVDRTSSLETVRWFRARFGGLQSELSGDELNGIARTFFKKAQQQALELRSDPKQFEQVKSHYRYSMECIASEAGEKGIPVLLCTVPVNLRDWIPLVSYNRLAGEERAEWQKSYNMGLRGFLNQKHEEGAACMAQAIELEPEHAESYFWMGRLLEFSDREKALEYSQRACDLDYNPFRAISDFNDSLRSIANETPEVHLVDLAAAFTRESKNGIPGFDLFLDYVHPNTQGHLLVAEEVLGAMETQGLLPLIRNDVSHRMTVRSANGVPYDAKRDAAVQNRMLNLYLYNHQMQAALEQFKYLHRMVMGRTLAPGESLPAGWPPKFIEGYEVLREYEALYVSWILGELVDPSELETAKTRVDAYYDTYFPYGTF